MTYTEKEPKVIKEKKYVLRRYSELQEFQCNRCHRIKKSKIVVYCETDKTEFCNACYGNISSK